MKAKMSTNAASKAAQKVGRSFNQVSDHVPPELLLQGSTISLGLAEVGAVTDLSLPKPELMLTETLPPLNFRLITAVRLSYFIPRQ